MVVPEGAGSSSPGSKQSRLRLVAVVGLVCLVGGWVLGSSTSSDVTAEPGSSTTVESTIQTSRPSSTVTTTEPTAPTAPIFLPPLRGAVQLVGNATAVDGSIALATGGSGALTGQNLWVIRPGGRLVQRVDMPFLQQGGIDYPILVVGKYVLVSGPNATYSLGIDLADPAQPLVVEPSFPIEDSGSTAAWIVGGNGPDWFARFDGETGQLGERTDVDSFGWPFRGFDGGLLFSPYSPDISDRVFVWRPSGEPEPLDLELGPETGLYAEAGGLAVELSPGSLISLVDIETGQITARLPFDGGEGLVNGVCFSPDQSYLAAVSSTGPVEVFRLATEESVGTMTTSETNWGVGWTSDSQLAFIAETPSGTRLRLFDVDTSSTVDIAELAAPGLWRIATSGPVC